MQRYIAQIKTAGLSCIVGINRAQIVVDRDGKGVTFVREINEWVMPLANHLSVLLAPSENPSAHVPTAGVEVRVFIAKQGDRWNEPLQTLASFAWPLSAASPLPYLVDIPFDVAGPPPSKLWIEADPIGALVDDDKDAIVELIERFRSAIERRHVGDAYMLTEYRYRDQARSSGESYEALEIGIRSLYQELFNEPAFRVEPLRKADAIFTRVAGDKVVLVGRGAGREALRVEVGQAPKRRFYGFQLYLARINGKWTIVR